MRDIIVIASDRLNLLAFRMRVYVCVYAYRKQTAGSERPFTHAPPHTDQKAEAIRQTANRSERPSPLSPHDACMMHTQGAHTGGQEENHPPGSPGIVYIYKWFCYLGLCYIYYIYNTITDKILLMRMDIPGRGYPENGSSFLFPYKGSNYC